MEIVSVLPAGKLQTVQKVSVTGEAGRIRMESAIGVNEKRIWLIVVNITSNFYLGMLTKREIFGRPCCYF